MAMIDGDPVCRIAQRKQSHVPAKNYVPRCSSKLGAEDARSVGL